MTREAILLGGPMDGFLFPIRDRQTELMFPMVYEKMALRQRDWNPLRSMKPVARYRCDWGNTFAFTGIHDPQEQHKLEYTAVVHIDEMQITYEMLETNEFIKENLQEQLRRSVLTAFCAHLLPHPAIITIAYFEKEFHHYPRGIQIVGRAVGVVRHTEFHKQKKGPSQ